MQRDCYKFGASYGYITRSCLETSEQTTQSEGRKNPWPDVGCICLLGSHEAEAKVFTS